MNKTDEQTEQTEKTEKEKSMKTIMTLVIALLFTQTTFAAEYRCIASGLRQHGAMPGKATLYFNFWQNGSVYFLKNVVGTIKAGGYTVDDAYIGQFNSPKTYKNNPNYRPNKYKSSVQFKSVNANNTRGLEDGMWGDLVVNTTENKSGILIAHYIFQAGDHMGGTVDLECVRR